ncbi:protein phosphatase 1 regulatory subunit 37 [Caerostris extrusa]|uniref:Protein phosphatase 1 regulatory subunit 37 n=1 Tax=Caerostris extrusa TaxID=172846 RepID=A0AAV4XFX5_CAEEX|nr:protein phosphatase 1 regulatory subunit 37 [Caerostris extrusa]
MLVTCYLEPPDPWSKVYGNTLNTLISSYVAACDKQGIKPLTCVLEQLQEFQSSSRKLEANPRVFDLSIFLEKLSMKQCEALEEVLRRLQFQLIDLEGCYLEDEDDGKACSRMLKKTTSLVHLNARSTGLNEQVLLIIGRALRLGSNLVTLHLENCGIYGRCLVILVAALKLNTTLRNCSWQKTRYLLQMASNWEICCGQILT